MDTSAVLEDMRDGSDGRRETASSFFEIDGEDGRVRSFANLEAPIRATRVE